MVLQKKPLDMSSFMKKQPTGRPTPIGTAPLQPQKPQPIGTYKGGAQLTNFATTAAKAPAPIAQYTRNEIQRKALAGIKMDSPTPEKTALYNSFLKKPTTVAKPTTPVKVTQPVKPVPNKNVAAVLKSMSPAMQAEIKRKALAGEPLQKTTEAKRWLYETFKPGGNPNGVKAAPTKSITPVKPAAPKYADTSQYLTAGQPTQQATTKPGSMVGPTDNGIARWNSNQSTPDYLGMTPDMIQKALAGLTGGGQQFDPENDASYKAMQQLNQRNSDKASQQSLELMNDRGILNSTVTSDRVGQIQQSGQDALLGMIPGMQANFNNQQTNNQAGLQNLLNSVMSGGQFQQQFAEGNRQFDKNFSLDEAETTGRYMPPEAQALLDSVMNAKKVTSMTNVSPQDRIKAGEQANAARAKLSAMGIDVSGINGNVGYQDSLNNMSSLGRNTITQQKQDLAKSEVMGKQMDTTAQALVQQVLKYKENNEKGIGNRQANAQSANDARAKLEAMGFDVSGIGGKVGYAQAVNNASSMGKNTLQRDSLNNDARQENADRAMKKDIFGQELAWEKDSFGKELAWEKDSFGQELGYKNKELQFEKDSFNREMNFTEQNAMIEADLASRGYDLEQIKLEIDQFNSLSDADYKLHQQSTGVSDQQASTNTNKAIGEVMKAGSAAEALEFFSESASTWADSAVDNRKVLDAINQRFPELKALADEGGTSTTSGGRYGTP